MSCNSAPRSTRTSSISENKSDQTMQKSAKKILIHTKLMPCIPVNLSVQAKGIHDAESVVTTELQ